MKNRLVPRFAFAGMGAAAPLFSQFATIAGLAALAACSSLSGPPATPAQPAPAVVSMDEWMARGDSAIKAGDHARARESWHAAARDYPAAPQPWLKLSEDYFDAADYGNAVLAAQEVLQRDPRDRVANSVLAVSGLRLTAGSLAALRDDGAYAVGSRDEAVALTRSLREALGEPVLVPPPEASSPRRRLAKTPRPSPRASGAADSGAPRTAAATPSTGNPLDKLK